MPPTKLLRLRRMPVLACIVCNAFAGSSAAADPLPMVTDRNYAIDLYDGAALGNNATISMGGANAAYAIGSSGTLTNPSASAVRLTTDRDFFSWDFHVDYLSGSQSTDYSNAKLTNPDGSPLTGEGTSVLTVGLALRFGNWAGALTYLEQRTPLDATLTTASGTHDIDGQTIHMKLALAKWFPSIDTAIGVAAQFGGFSIDAQCNEPECDVFTVSGLGVEAGASWIPSLLDFRIGAAFASPIVSDSVTSTNCDPNDCGGYILPNEVRMPWRLVVGGAYRFSESAWNQLVKTDFRDERAVTAVLDVVVSGPSQNGFGLDAFGQHELERSGSSVAISPRGGAEFEWLPGRLRVRAGSYWEPARFDSVGGRIHGTFGLELRVFDFHLLGHRRGKLEVTADLASQYRNIGASIGFWH